MSDEEIDGALTPQGCAEKLSSLKFSNAIVFIEWTDQVLGIKGWGELRKGGVCTRRDVHLLRGYSLFPKQRLFL